jgi:NTE family protein
MHNINLNNVFDTLCFSGGGTTCISFIGVLKYLVDNNYLNLLLIKNFVGTSGGAITAFLLSLNYSIDDIYEFILSFNFKTLENNNQLNNLFKNNGFNNGTKFNYLFSQFIYNKLNINNITFQELFNLTNNKLLIIGTNYSKGCEEIFSYDTTPNMSIIIALRISMSIPVLFTPVYYNSNYYVDGALINNFPFNHCNKLSTLGLFIDNSYNEINNIDNIIILFKRSIEIILNNINKNKFKNYNNNIIIIDRIITELVNYNLSFDEKNKLLNHGIQMGIKFINNFNYDNFHFKNQYTQT